MASDLDDLNEILNLDSFQTELPIETFSVSQNVRDDLPAFQHGAQSESALTENNAPAQCDSVFALFDGDKKFLVKSETETLPVEKNDNDTTANDFWKSSANWDSEHKSESDQRAKLELSPLSSSRQSSRVKEREMHELATRIQHENQQKEREAMRRMNQGGKVADCDVNVNCKSSPTDESSHSQRRRKSRVNYAKMNEGAVFFAGEGSADEVSCTSSASVPCDLQAKEAESSTQRLALTSTINELLSNESESEAKVKRKEEEQKKSNRTSSETIASRNESEEEESEEDEDTSTLYCLCRQPYGKRFMIACDRCNDWFHGECVGVSRRRGRQLAQCNAEFICPLCTERGRLDVQFAAESTEERERRFVQIREQLIAQTQAQVRESQTAVKADTQDAPSEKAAEKKGAVVSDRKLAAEKVLVGPAAKKSKRDVQENSAEVADNGKPDNVQLSELRRKGTSSKLESHSSTTAKAMAASKSKSVTVDNVNQRSNCHSKEDTTSNGRRCRAQSCNRPLTTQSTYCSHKCVETYAREALQMLRKTNKGIALADYDRVPVVDRRLGKVLRGSEAPIVSKLVTFLERYVTFEVVLPTSSVGAPAVKNDTSRKLKTAAYAKPTVSSSSRAFGSLSVPCSSSAAKANKVSQSVAKPSSDSTALPVTENRIAVRRDIGRILNEQAEKADDVYLSPAEIRKLAVAIEEALHAFCGTSRQSDTYRTRSQRIVDALKDSANMVVVRRILNAQLKPSELVRLNDEELRFAPQKRVGTTSVNSVTLPKPASNNPKAPCRPSARDTSDEHGRHAFDFNCRSCLAQARKDEQERLRAAQTAEQSAKATVIGNPSSTTQPSESSTNPPVPQLPAASQQSQTVSVTENEKTKTRVEYSVDSIRVEPPFESHPLANSLQTIWSGTLSCNELESFTIRMLPVSGALNAFDLPEKLRLCGRIHNRNVLKYLVSLRRSANHSLAIGRLVATSASDLGAFRAFCCSFVNRCRYGVVAFPPTHVKDLYVAPMDAVPDELLPFEGPGLADFENAPDLESQVKLLCLVIKHRDPPSASPAPPLAANATPRTSTGSTFSLTNSASSKKTRRESAQTVDTNFYQPSVKRVKSASENVLNAPESPTSDEPMEIDPTDAPNASSPVLSFPLPVANNAAPIAIPLSSTESDRIETVSTDSTPKQSAGDIREMISAVSSIVNLIQRISNKQPVSSSGNDNPNDAPSTPINVLPNSRLATPSASATTYPFSVSQMATRQMLATTMHAGTPSKFAQTPVKTNRQSLGVDDEYTPDFVTSDVRPPQNAEYKPQLGPGSNSKTRTRPSRSRWDN